MSEQSEQIQTRIAIAIESALAEFAHSAANKWVALIDNTDLETGERSVWHCTSDDLSAWDSLGLLTWAVQLEQSAAARRTDDD